MTYNYSINTHSQLADLDTPISIYLKLRDYFDRVVLLESNDFHEAENSHSFICCDALHSIRVDGDHLTTRDGAQMEQEIVPRSEMLGTIKQSIARVQCNDASGIDFSVSNFFGYFSYDAVRYFEEIEVTKHDDSRIPDIALDFFRFVIVFDHFRQSVHVVEHLAHDSVSQIDLILGRIRRSDVLTTPFALNGPLRSNLTDDQYGRMVRQGIEHCQQGDVFQVVLSRAFSQGYSGDDFNVYRALRTINPSPYLFYFDYGDYRLFGSSPESQLTVADRFARINPIAGTYPRTGDPETDRLASERLLEDEKELSEHTMLVDLARNDLNRNANAVEVEAYREIHKYSHVIHMVSQVRGEIGPETNVLDVFADCFPAGTLSGAPKYRAMEIISDLEPTDRGFYGGAIGFFDLDQNMNTAIMIRSILSINNILHLQAGAGIVASSDPGKETAEVRHKIQALIKSLEHASKQHHHEAAIAG